MKKNKHVLPGVIALGAIFCALFSPFSANSLGLPDDGGESGPTAHCEVKPNNICLIVSTPLGDKSWPGVLKVE